MDNRYVVYVRKSSEQEERQALSIAAQLRELEEYAAKEQLQIVTETAARRLRVAQKNQPPRRKSVIILSSRHHHTPPSYGWLRVASHFYSIKKKYLNKKSIYPPKTGMHFLCRI